MSKTRMRISFILSWGVLFACSQLPIFLLFSAVDFEPNTVIVGECLLAITTVMIIGLLLAKEDYDGKENIRKK